MAKKKARKPAPAASKEVLTAIKASAEDIQKKIIARKKPTMRFPVRSLTNVEYRPDRGFFEIAGDHDRDTGKVLRIDCTKFGSGAYSIPISVEHLQFETNADFILVIETAGMFQRLVKHNYWKKADCILVSMGGVPTRACRRFIRRLADFKKIPVYVFVDGDPYGITNIYRTLKVRSGNAAHLNEFFYVA